MKCNNPSPFFPFPITQQNIVSKTNLIQFTGGSGFFHVWNINKEEVKRSRQSITKNSFKNETQAMCVTCTLRSASYQLSDKMCFYIFLTNFFVNMNLALKLLTLKVKIYSQPPPLSEKKNPKTKKKKNPQNKQKNKRTNKYPQKT